MTPRLNSLLIVAVLLMLGLAAFLTLRTPFAWLLIPILIGAAWMLGDPKRLLAGYWLYASVAEYSYHISGIQYLRYGDEALLVLIVISIAFTQALRRQEFPEIRLLLASFWAMIVVLLISFLVNGGSPLRAAVTVVQYFRPFILGYFAYITLRLEDLPAICKFFLATLVVQLAINLHWLAGLTVLPHPGFYTGIDFAVGTMGSSLQIGYTACLGLFLAIAMLLTLRRTSYAGMVLILMLSFVLTYTIHAYVFLGLGLALMALTIGRQPLARIAAAVGGLAGLTVVAYALYLLKPDFLNLQFLLQRGHDLLAGRKMDSYLQHFTELHRDVPVLFLGAGPGNLGSAMADERAYLPTKYHAWGFTQLELFEQASGSIISHTRTGLLSIYGDMGPLVFLIYWGLHLYAMMRVIRAYRQGDYDDAPWQKALALSFPPAMLFYLLAAFMTDIVHMALWGFLPWVWLATVWTPQKTTSAEAPVFVAEPPHPTDVIVQRNWV